MSQAKRLKFSTTVLGDSTPNTILKMQAAIRGSLHPAACPGQPQSTVLRSSTHAVMWLFSVQYVNWVWHHLPYWTPSMATRWQLSNHMSHCCISCVEPTVKISFILNNYNLLDSSLLPQISAICVTQYWQIQSKSLGKKLTGLL